MDTILVCDDMKTDRELVGKVVTGAGHSVIYASDGAEAVARAKELKPSLIFLDVVMPNQDGFKTCRTLKQDPQTAGIPVVLVTSKATDSDKFWAKKQGADDHVGKPFSPDALLAIIRRYTR